LLNPQEKDFHKWKVGTVKEEYLKTVIVTKCDNPSCDTLSSDQYRQFVIDNAYRIFRGIAPKGVGKGLSDAMAESKKTGGWAIYRREDNDDIYTYKGEMVRFYSKNLKVDQNGKTTITRELGSLWTDIPWTGIANEGGVKFKNGKKPEALLRRVIEMNSEPGDLVLDYHLGSGTTAAVAHKMGRQYIGIEQLNYGENDATQRLKNVIAGDKTGASKSVGWAGGGDFVYLELAERNPKLLAQIEKATSTKQLLSSWDEISSSPFVSHKIDLMKLKDSRDEFEQLSVEDAKSALLEMLDKNAIYINISELEDKTNGLKASDIALNKAFYGLN
jgi:adenine-specific DNA-methyltransferase